MNGLLIRRTTGIGVMLLMASLVVMVGLPVAAIEGNCTETEGWTVGATSGPWGTITNNGDGSVTVVANAGYSLELCVKGGSGYEIYNVTGSGGTFWPPADCGTNNPQCGLSHWGIRSVVLTTTTTTGATTTTAGATTTTAGATTTTGGTPTTTAATTTSQEVTTTSAATAVLGIQVSAPVAAQVNQATTQETLPFTGVSSGSLAMLASVISGVGLLLLLASRESEERVTARSWR